MNRFRTRLAAAVVGGGLIVLVPTAAGAAPSRPDRSERAERPERAERSPEEHRQRCLAAVEKRREALERATEHLDEAKHVTDQHRTALAAIIDGTSASLATLAGDIGAGTDPENLKSQCRSILRDHRVFALVLPRTRLVTASDIALAGAAKLEVAASRIEAAIEQAEAAGSDVTEARAGLAAMRERIASAQASAGGVPGPLMDLVPADWNADHEVLVPARVAMKSARTDLREARDLGREIVSALKG